MSVRITAVSVVLGAEARRWDTLLSNRRLCRLWQGLQGLSSSVVVEVFAELASAVASLQSLRPGTSCVEEVWLTASSFLIVAARFGGTRAREMIGDSICR